MKGTITLAMLAMGIIFLSGCAQKNQNLITNPEDKIAERFPTQPIPRPEKENESNNNINPMELKIETTQPGTGDRTIKAGDAVSVQYIGMLTDGTKFDSSYDRGGQPFVFQVGAGQVIKGWDQGLLGAKMGEKRKLTIPPDFGYGAAGVGNIIPPNATLIFEVEVVSIQ